MAEVQNFRTALNGFNRQDVVHYIEYLNNKHAAEVEQLSTQLSTTQEALANAPSTTLKQQLEGKIADLEKTVAQLRAAAPVTPAPADPALRQQLDEAQAAKAELEQTVARLQQELDAKTAAVAELEGTVDKLHLELAERTTEITNLKNTAAEPIQAPAAQDTEILNLKNDLEAMNGQLEAEKAKGEALQRTVAELQAALAQKATAENPNAAELEAYRRAERVEREALERAEQVNLQTDAILADVTARVTSSTAKVSAVMELLDAQLKQCQEAVDAARATFAEVAPVAPTPVEEA